MVLLKGFGQDGFRFFTNHESRKGKELVRAAAALGARGGSWGVAVAFSPFAPGLRFAGKRSSPGLGQGSSRHRTGAGPAAAKRGVSLNFKAGSDAELLTALSSLPAGRQPLRFARLLLGAPQPAGELPTGDAGGAGGSRGSSPWHGVRQRVLPPAGWDAGARAFGWGSRSDGSQPLRMGRDGMGGACILRGESRGMGQFLTREPTQPLWHPLARAQLTVPGTGTD